MSLHDAYYDPPEDDDAENFAERVAFKMKYSNNPYTEENILEAIADEALNQHIQALATLLASGDKLAAGTVLSSALFTYWEQRTEREVEDDPSGDY